SLLETTPTLRWTGKVGDASAFRVWGSRAFVRDTSADKLSSRAVPCVFLGFPPDAPGWQFYHPTSRRVLSSQDVTFVESVSYYRLFPYCAASLPPPPLFLAPGRPCRAGRGSVDSGAAGGAEPERVESGGAETERVEPGGAEPGGIASGGAEPTHAESGDSPGVLLRREPLSPQRLREWYARRCRRATGAPGGAAGVGAAGGAAGAGAAGGATGARATGGAGAAGGAAGAGAAGPGGARTGGTGAAGAGGAAGVGAGGAAGVVTGDPGAEGTGAVSAVSGGAARPRPYYVSLLQQVLGLPPSPGPAPPLLSPPPV
ncbi:unnamed protein product, partial [Closterium sp. NIES-54]